MFQQSQSNDGKHHKKIDHVTAILSMNRALLGEVFPSLRAGKIKWNDEKVSLFFYYDGEISEDDYESLECVATEVIADFPEHVLEIEILRWDYPKPIPRSNTPNMELVYHRKEKHPQTIM